MSHQKARVDEEDDLDDLDDVIDQFSSPAPPPAPPANASTSSEPTRPEGDEFDEAEFTRQMESMLGELGLNPGGAGAGGDEASKKLAAAWEAMLVEEMNATSDPSASTSTSQPKPDFQSRIRSVQDRLGGSESDLQNSGPDLLEQLLSPLQGLGVDDPQNKQIEEMLESMMGQLMNKDVLYEPLKELYEKFPGYLAKHANTISPEDKARYEAQISWIKKLIDEFEAPSYRDDDEKTREKIVELMGELQKHGQPPEEIMGPMPPGMSLGADGLPEMPSDCPTS